jgi:hypothetical protein
MQKRGVVASIALHLILIALVLVSPKTNVEIVKPLEIQVVASDSLFEVKKPIKAQQKFHASSRSLVKTTRASQLFPTMKYSSSTLETTSSQSTYGASIDQVFGDNGNQNWSYYQEIYRKIDSHLIFDSLLAQNSHFGRVYVEFKVTDEGIFEMSQLKVVAQDPILKVHVLRVIKKSLDLPLAITKVQKFNADTLFKAEFDFQLGNPADNFLKQKNFGKPIFVFTRSTLEKPVPDNLKDQLLEGGVSPNISQMYENWKKYNKMKYRNATQFDPFASYKRDEFYAL